jgi:hypothetical protein
MFSVLENADFLMRLELVKDQTGFAASNAPAMPNYRDRAALPYCIQKSRSSQTLNPASSPDAAQ